MTVRVFARGDILIFGWFIGRKLIAIVLIKRVYSVRDVCDKRKSERYLFQNNFDSILSENAKREQNTTDKKKKKYSEYTTLK